MSQYLLLFTSSYLFDFVDWSRNNKKKFLRSSRPEVFLKKVFLKISQNSQENTCARVLKKRLWRMCFSVNFAKFLRTPFFAEHLWWLLLIPVVFTPENNWLFFILYCAKYLTNKDLLKAIFWKGNCKIQSKESR